MKNKESIKDKFFNTILFIRNWIRSKFIENSKLGKDCPNTDNMRLVFQEEFTELNKSVWRIGQPWGLFHPEGPHQYYGEDAVIIKNGLVLKQFYSPKKLKNWDSEKEYDIPFSVGLITSHQSFGYGFYQFDVKLPKGPGLWPAVWLSCVDSWPPEIDIFEGYSDKNSDYKNNLQSNFHYNFDPNKENAGARNHPVYCNDKKIVMSCWWTKDFIKVYYNGILVRQITSENILKWFRDKKMTIILNNAVRPEFVEQAKGSVSEFKIYSVKYWQ